MNGILTVMNVIMVAIFYAAIASVFGFWGLWLAILLPVMAVWIGTSKLISDLLRKGDSNVER